MAKLFEYLQVGLPEGDVQSTDEAKAYVKVYVEALKVDSPFDPSGIRKHILIKLVAFFAKCKPRWDTKTFFDRCPKRGRDLLFVLLLQDLAYELKHPDTPYRHVHILHLWHEEDLGDADLSGWSLGEYAILSDFICDTPQCYISFFNLPWIKLPTDRRPMMAIKEAIDADETVLHRDRNECECEACKSFMVRRNEEEAQRKLDNARVIRRRL